MKFISRIQKINWLKIMKFSAVQLMMFLVFAGVTYARPGTAQINMEQRVDLHMHHATIASVLHRLEKVTNVKFVYSLNLVDVKQKVDVEVKAARLDSVLHEVLVKNGIGYEVINNRVVLVPRRFSTLAEMTDGVRIHGLQLELLQHEVRGKVTDESGNPLAGVTVQVKNTNMGTTTDNNGNYVIHPLSGNDTLVFSFIGYERQEVPIQNRSLINIQLHSTATGLNQVVVVGYGTQRKVDVTGAISTINSHEIVTTKNENLQNMLTGKIPGVRVVQRTAEPGSFDNAFDIRGMGTPLVVIDGVPRTLADFQRLNPDDIESISVLKDASAAIYGIRSANGVILVTTKKGERGKSVLSYSGNYTWQFPSGLPKTVDIYQYMTLRNEKAKHNVNGGSPIFTEKDFEDYRTGKKRSTDWYPLVFAPYAPETQHNISVSGGSNKILYYIGGEYLYQGSFFKSGDLKYNRYNLRSNITANISDQLTLGAGFNFVSEETNHPYVDSWWIIRAFWRQGPQIPAYANNDFTKPFHGLIEGDNPISFMNKDIVGYKKFINNWIQPSLNLKLNFPFIKGLYAKTLFSFDYALDNRTYFQKEYQQYRYDEASKTYLIFTRQSPNRITRESYFRSQIVSQTSLNYSGIFGRHNVSGILIWETQKRKGDNLIAQRDLTLPIPYLFAGISTGQIGMMNTGSNDLYETANLGLAGRVTYSFSDKYLAEFLFRYDGSSKFAPGKQWGFFPGGAVGWRISEERFIKNNNRFSFINQLKVRASYGVTGDDGAADYQWVAGYRYPAPNDLRRFSGGYVFDGNFVASVTSATIPNPLITWYTSKTFDAGIDFEGWNGLLSFTFDYFNRIRSGLLAQRTGGLPTVVGATLPQENLNSDMTFGYDMSISHHNKIGRLTYNLMGIVSYTRVKAIHVESPPFGSSWSNWRNNQNDRLQGIWWGLKVTGHYQNWEDIWSSPVYVSRGTLPGDYKYEDWNGDGEINSLDLHPIRQSSTPWLNFSLIGNASYKGFDISFLLQGSALTTVQYGEQLREPLWGNNESGAMVQFMDRWHPADPNADPYDPATVWIPGYFAYTGTLPDPNSSFNAVDGSYLRLKTIELGYTLPSRITHRIGIGDIRVYTNGYNLVTWTKVRYIDPEHPNTLYGYLYPLNKTVSVGINISF